MTWLQASATPVAPAGGRNCCCVPCWQDPGLGLSLVLGVWLSLTEKGHPAPFLRVTWGHGWLGVVVPAPLAVPARVPWAQPPFLHHRPPEGQSYQSSGGDSYQNSAIDQSFWDNFGGAEPGRARQSPSSDSWTCADVSAEKRSSDSWDVWGSASNNRSSDLSDGGGGGEGRTPAPRKVAPTLADEGWDVQDW